MAFTILMVENESDERKTVGESRNSKIEQKRNKREIKQAKVCKRIQKNGYKIFLNTEGKTRVSNGDTALFWTSDEQPVTGMTHKQKWQWQSRASNKRTSFLCLTVSVGECVGGRVHITEFFFCACGFKLPWLRVCLYVCVFHPPRERVRVCFLKVTTFHTKTTLTESITS